MASTEVMYVNPLEVGLRKYGGSYANIRAYFLAQSTYEAGLADSRAFW